MNVYLNLRLFKYSNVETFEYYALKNAQVFKNMILPPFISIPTDLFRFLDQKHGVKRNNHAMMKLRDHLDVLCRAAHAESNLLSILTHKERAFLLSLPFASLYHYVSGENSNCFILN